MNIAVYVINEFEITDTAAFEAYPALAAASIMRYGGQIPARACDGQAEAIEGMPSKHVILLEFPDVATVKRWFNSDDYPPARAIRQIAAKCRVIIVEGVPLMRA